MIFFRRDERSSIESSACHCMTEKGFTLIEMMAVVVIIAIFVTVAILNVDSILPTYELRQTARQVGNVIQRAKSYAKHQARDMAIMYDFENNICWIVPAEAEFDKTEPHKYALKTYRLPDGMEFNKIVFADDSSVETDIRSVRVSSAGLVVPHYVHIEREGKRKYTVMVRMMAGTVEYSDGYVRPEYDDALGE